jgi:hypothetical protein
MEHMHHLDEPLVGGNRVRELGLDRQELARRISRMGTTRMRMPVPERSSTIPSPSCAAASADFDDGLGGEVECDRDALVRSTLECTIDSGMRTR